jgi:hypothetical protein
MSASGYNNSTGYVKVYRTNYDGGNRVQLGQTIYGNATYDCFGYSLDITPNGTAMVCGSPGNVDYVYRTGYVRVFSLVGGDDDLGTDTSWKQIGQDIMPL